MARMATVMLKWRVVDAQLRHILNPTRRITGGKLIWNTCMTSSSWRFSTGVNAAVSVDILAYSVLIHEFECGHLQGRKLSCLLNNCNT